MKREITPEQKEKVIRKIAAALVRNKIKFAEEGFYKYCTTRLVHKDEDNIQRQRNTNQL